MDTLNTLAKASVKEVNKDIKKLRLHNTRSIFLQDLIEQVLKGEVRLPTSGNAFDWNVNKAGKLFDSIFKEYPIGTLLIWETTEYMDSLSQFGELQIPDSVKSEPVKYLLDGQKRVKFILAAYLKLKLEDEAGNVVSDFSKLYIDLSKDFQDTGADVVTTSIPSNSYSLLSDIIDESCIVETLFKRFKNGEISDRDVYQLKDYKSSFSNYDCSLIEIEDFDSKAVLEILKRNGVGEAFYGFLGAIGE